MGVGRRLGTGWFLVLRLPVAGARRRLRLRLPVMGDIVPCTARTAATFLTWEGLSAGREVDAAPLGVAGVVEGRLAGGHPAGGAEAGAVGPEDEVSGGEGPVAADLAADGVQVVAGGGGDVGGEAVAGLGVVAAEREDEVVLVPCDGEAVGDGPSSGDEAGGPAVAGGGEAGFEERVGRVEPQHVGAAAEQALVVGGQVKPWDWCGVRHRSGDYEPGDGDVVPTRPALRGGDAVLPFPGDRTR